MDLLREGLARLSELLANLNIKHALIASGVLVAALSAWRWIPARVLGAGRRQSLIENTQVALYLLVVIFLLVRPHLFQAFFIPSGSMIPTFKEGDRLVVNKLIYRLVPPRRGEIMVFVAPEAAQHDGKEFIKRVIGLPGDRVEVRGTRLLADGKAVLHLYEELATPTGSHAEILPGIQVTQTEVQATARNATIGLDDGLCHVVLAPLSSVREVGGYVLVGEQSFGSREAQGRLIPEPDVAQWGAEPGVRCRAFVRADRREEPALLVVEAERLTVDDPHVWVNGQRLQEPYLAEPIRYVMAPIRVPAGHYFMLGDNRNSSHDGHVWGFVPASHIIGRAEITFWPLDRLRLHHWWLLMALALSFALYAGGRWLVMTCGWQPSGRIAFLEE